MTSEESNDLSLSPVQCKAARALLAWSQVDLARQASVAVSTVADFERGRRSPVTNNLDALKGAFQRAGVTILTGGVVAGPVPASVIAGRRAATDTLRPIRWVDESDLAHWADRRDGQDTLPELVRRLIIAEQGYVPTLRFASRDSVSMHGWDGLTLADRVSAHVASGWGGWEIGTNRNPGKKADDDYTERVKNPAPLDMREATFTFITPRRWAKKTTWIAERRTEGIWAKVNALDAVDLVQWVEQYPAVGLWLRGEIYGRSLDGIQELGERSGEWSAATRLPLSASLVLSSRDNEAASVWRWLHGDPAVLAVEAEAPGEAIAFLSAAIGQLPTNYSDFYSGKAVVVANPGIARALADVPSQLIIVLEQPEPGIAVRLVEKGHHVFLPFGSEVGSGSDLVKLPRPFRYDIEEGLAESGYRKEEAEAYAQDCARSLTVLRRLVPAASGYEIPKWARPELGRTLLPVLFAGAWNEKREADCACLAELAGKPYDQFIGQLTPLLAASDSPLRKVGTIWKIASPRDAWFRLARYISDRDLKKFASVAKEVLGATDPRFAMAGDERIYAPLDGHTPSHSAYLRTGLTEALVLIGVFGQQAVAVANARERAALIVRDLLHGATAERWWSLSDQLREMAEAAPDTFLDCVEESLSKNDPPIVMLFKEDSGGLFGKAYHTDLVWALETLAWSPDYLSRVTGLLAAMVTLDSGGSWGNRPANSLQQIYLPWHPQTNVGLDDRLKVLRRLRKSAPEAAWRLFLDIYPKDYGSADNSPLPRWRDFSVEVPEIVTRKTLRLAADQLGAWLLEDAGANAGRWVQLIERFPDLSKTQREEFVAKAAKLNELIRDDHDRAKIRKAIRNLLNHHRQFANTNWALAEDELVALEEPYEEIALTDPILQIAWLFEDFETSLPNPIGHDYHANRTAAREARNLAVRNLLANSGMSGVVELIAAVKIPGFVGEAFAEVAEAELVDEALATALKSEEQKNLKFAHGIIAALAQSREANWGDRLISRALAERWGDNTVARILLSLPCTEGFMRRASEIDGEVASKYWGEVSTYGLPSGPVITPWIVERLLEHGRGGSAITLVGHTVNHVPADLLVRVLEAGAENSQREADETTMFQHHVEQIFRKLDTSDEIPPHQLARLEWIYLKVLEHSGRPPVTLHRQLASQPEFFIEVLSTIYRANGEDAKAAKDEDRATDAALAKHAWTLLNSWQLLPGSVDGELDSGNLERWFHAARRLAHEAGRAEIGDEKIGEIFAWAPADAEGVWPCGAVRDLIEVARSHHLESGIFVGVRNKRGGTSRGVFDGGELEREEAKLYRDHADGVRFEWRRTAAVLDRIAESYEDEAKDHDDEAERRQW